MNTMALVLSGTPSSAFLLRVSFLYLNDCPFILCFWYSHLVVFVVVVFNVYRCFICIYVCTPYVCLVFAKARIGCHIPLGLELQLVVIVILNPEELSPDPLNE